MKGGVHERIKYTSMKRARISYIDCINPSPSLRACNTSEDLEGLALFSLFMGYACAWWVGAHVY